MGELKTTFEWNQIPWRKLERKTFKLQKRIFQASSRGDVKAVHRLQKMLMKSWSAKCLAVRRVTQDNRGKKTAGVDGLKSLSPKARLILVASLKVTNKVAPTIRVWIPKPGSKEKRPLGIPTMYDRALQALTKMALEPEWEAKFEPNTYGFRPGRSCHDAIEAIFISIIKQPKYVLDADISKCFDRINHTALLNKLETTPTLRRVIKAWLKAGVVEYGIGYLPTKAGTPQGGVISPLLANIALHGLENRIKQAFPRRYPTVNRKEVPIPSPEVIRYADDFVILHKDLSVIKKAQEVAADWLKGMGLELKPSKTKISHTLEKYEGSVGFDFLGFNVRQYKVGKYRTKTLAKGYKTLIKPSQERVRQHIQQIGEVIDSLKAATQENLIGKLNLIIKGWCNYYSSVVSKNVFRKANYLTYQKLRAWAIRRHPKKGKKWVSNKYWHIWDGKGWNFTAKGKVRTLKLLLHSDVPIVRHIKVKGNKSPYDGDWSYWATRMGKHPETPKRVSMLLKRQKGICHNCGLYLTSETHMEVHHLDKNHKNNRWENLALVHNHCHDQIHQEQNHDTGKQKLVMDYTENPF